MLESAVAIVAKVWFYGDTLLVGDALGVDAAVVKAAEGLRLGYQCYGIDNAPRNGANNYINVSPMLQLRHYSAQRRFQMRDFYMVENADVVICIWNGKSRGTRVVYDYATQQGKTVYLKQFTQPQNYS
jgi:hypothetical protein